MHEWPLVFEALILLTSALLLGTLAERYRQSAIVGYILAGTAVGPNGLAWVKSEAGVDLLAELGIALLLFTIGLEFSFRRLRQLGTIALGGGSLQVLLTGAAVALIVSFLGIDWRAAIILGAMAALSSTATVLRLLSERAQLESPFGRTSLGVLLLQDMAVVPLALITSALASGGSGREMIWLIARTTGGALLLLIVFIVLFNVLAPRLLTLRNWARNREFPILLAVIMALGSALAAQRLEVSPSIGAFFAGVLLASSPFAVQIRADVASMRTVFVTLFFASVGMLADPVWVVMHAPLVLSVVAAVVLLKLGIVWGIMRGFGISAGMALATGLCLAQVGEFAFVLAQIARGSIFDESMVRLIAAVSVITLLITPYMLSCAMPAARWLETRHRPPDAAAPAPAGDGAPTPASRILIIGFGPAGQRVADALVAQHREQITVIDLNPRLVDIARAYGVSARLGNAWQSEVLASAGIQETRAVVVTIPEPESSRQIIALCRNMNASASVFARARYHVLRWELQLAGADVVTDEEELVGLRLAAEVRRTLAGTG